METDNRDFTARKSAKEIQFTTVPHLTIWHHRMPSLFSAAWPCTRAACWRIFACTPCSRCAGSPKESEALPAYTFPPTRSQESMFVRRIVVYSTVQATTINPHLSQQSDVSCVSLENLRLLGRGQILTQWHQLVCIIIPKQTDGQIERRSDEVKGSLHSATVHAMVSTAPVVRFASSSLMSLDLSSSNGILMRDRAIAAFWARFKSMRWMPAIPFTD